MNAGWSWTGKGRSRDFRFLLRDFGVLGREGNGSCTEGSEERVEVDDDGLCVPGRRVGLAEPLVAEDIVERRPKGA